MRKILLFVLPALLLLCGCEKEETTKVVVNVSTPEITIEANATGDDLSQSFQITTNGNWVAKPMSGDWITLGSEIGNGNATLEFTVSEYIGAADRTASIGVFTDNDMAYVTVIQKGVDVPDPE